MDEGGYWLLTWFSLKADIDIRKYVDKITSPSLEPAKKQDKIC